MSSPLFSRLHGIFKQTPKNISVIAEVDALAAATTKKSPNTSTPLNVQETVRRFKKNSRNSAFRRRQDYYESSVRRLAAGNHYSAIESILDYQKKYIDSATKEGFAVRLISLYGMAGMFDHAYKLFDELPSLGLTPSVNSFNALLSACINSKKLDKISELFLEVPEKLGIEPDVVSYNTLIKAFCEEKSLESAMKTMVQMEKDGINPDIVSYNTILEWYYKENMLKDAEELWGLMEEKGVAANVRSYNSKIRSMVRNNQVVEAVEFVEEMEKGEVKPDMFTYNAVIKGCVNNENLEEAKRLHGKMVDNHCVPDHVTFGLLLPLARDKGDLDFALKLCKDAIQLQVPVYKNLMQAVVDGLIVRSMVEEAKELTALVNTNRRIPYTLKVSVHM